jgi:putative endonuclease
MHPEHYFVYMVASRNRRALYIGVTNDLVRRAYEHRYELLDGFSKRYHCVDLVYYEEWGSVADAISREKQLKRWRRDKKDELIESTNPTLTNLTANWEK